ncbi:MAG: hypothetical protein HOV67_35715 [Kribbellaceae bacterium]|nr:hypothetical protein [Kribbellaceae bacterium]
MIFPVGHGAGPNVVRVGRRAEHLSDSEFETWDLAHQATGDEALPLVDELVRRGLLVRVDDVTAFAQQYRLLPLFIGLGNHPDEPDRYAIGVQGLAPLAVVDERTYELWQWGWVAPSLWAHCEVQATLGEQPQLLDGVSTLLAEYVAVLEPVS